MCAILGGKLSFFFGIADLFDNVGRYLLVVGEKEIIGEGPHLSKGKIFSEHVAL